MRKSDLSPGRQKLLVPVPEYSGSFALIPPPTPYSIPSRTISAPAFHAHEALGALREATARLPNPDLVTRTFDRREAVRSSQIEGTSSGMDELYTYEATGSDEGLPPDVVVTQNYVLSLEFGLQEVRRRGPASLTTQLIKDLHRYLMEGTGYRGQPGEFRNRQNWIGARYIHEARFVPPPADHVESCIEDLVKFLQSTPQDEDMLEVPIVIRMAIAHAQFETIHPFTDGNGRVGRILLPLMLAAEGYPPVYIAGYLKRHQQMYYDLLAGVQLKDEWPAWIQFFASAVESGAKESISTASTLEVILSRWEAIVAELKLRSDSAVNRLPELLIGSPVVTARQVEKALGVSFPAASNALSKLVETGILTQQGESRNRRFVAREVIDLLNRSPEESAMSREDEVLEKLEAEMARLRPIKVRLLHGR